MVLGSLTSLRRLFVSLTPLQAVFSCQKLMELEQLAVASFILDNGGRLPNTMPHHVRLPETLVSGSLSSGNCDRSVRPSILSLASNLKRLGPLLSLFTATSWSNCS